ncbi:MAG: hypothetical protein CM15mP21_0150 [Hyphomicrobiales bacterium]|nr:MAG: hypothetical protein CM15mP21_0150 [Hyphomicrobiales bacterium]
MAAEYGGGGLSKEENKILQEELARIKARPALTEFGLWMLGPALLEFASEEQKKNISVKSSAAKSAGVRVIRARCRL